MGLKKYKAKRDFAQTAEPKGGKPLPKQVRGASRFVIQKHDARRLHYDFRLQMEGVLKSWALPKGLPWQQGEKHLAVEVEDHPLEYETFEGIIPEGQYGGGTVMVWDRGAYYVYGEQPLKSLREGKLHLVLAGEKAKGEWTLVRIRGRDGEKNQWLILKTGGSAKPPSKKTEDQSVKTGRTMKQVAEERDAEWESNREEKNPSQRSTLKSRIKVALKKKDQEEVEAHSASPEKTRGGRRNKEETDLDGQLGKLSLPKAKPQFVEPMKARLVDDPPTHGDWLYELKFDGIRAIAVKNNRKTSLISRNGNKLDARFPEIAEAIKKLPVRDCVIDGEVVALDEEGRCSFQLLQALEVEGRKAPLRFYIFDLLELDGKSLLGLPLEQRKQVLAKLCEIVGDPIRYSGEISGNVKSLLAEVQRRGLEGLIGKQRNSVYEPGRRSGTWIKLKCVTEQEFVIGGYTPPAGSRKHFGAILVGYYDGGKLKFAGKVGSGFTGKSLSILSKKFREEEREDCPFIDLPSKLATGRVRPTGGQGGAWVQGITPSMMKKMHWVNPKFVAEIKFAEWTRDGKLRQPVFLGLREDKRATEVKREAA
jgi:bifunctional non-homologous end joining protein LigD